MKRINHHMILVLSTLLAILIPVVSSALEQPKVIAVDQALDLRQIPASTMYQPPLQPQELLKELGQTLVTPGKSSYASGRYSGTDSLSGPGNANRSVSRFKHEYRTDRILIKTKVKASKNEANFKAKLNAFHASNNTKVLKTYKHIEDIQLIEIPKNLTVEEAIGKYEKSGLVEYAEPDYKITIFSTNPNDPLYDWQSINNTSEWGLNNMGQDGGTTDADIDAPEAWDVINNASDVVVAVIDTGIDYNHEDLTGNLWTNAGEIPGNDIDDDNNGYVDDVYGINAITGSGNPLDDCGHGTHCAGTIGAATNNATGVAGICWHVKMMACKFLDSDGSGNTSDAIECINYAREMGANIMSNSWGGSGYSESLYNAIQTARNAGIIFVAAAGNSTADIDSQPAYPAAYDLDSIVSVAATDRNDDLASFSNYGLERVDIGAPGVDIVSLRASGTDIYGDGTHIINSNYYRASGTSMACPHVAGAMALLKAQYPSNTYHQLITRLFNSTESLTALEDKCVTGGRLNLYNAITYTPADMYIEPLTDVRFGGMPGNSTFYPSSRSYMITNFSTSSIDWSVDWDEQWVSVTPTSGTIAPNASQYVTVSVNSYASILSEGEHADTLVFTNESTGNGNTSRDLILRLGPVYVKPDGNDSSDGYSWQNAKQTIKSALDNAFGQEIWVAAGNYASNLVFRDGTYLYGGFTGNETLLSQRDPAANITSLKSATTVETTDVPIWIPSGVTETVVDGFTIYDGNDFGYCAVICGTYSGGTISNNKIIRNLSTTGTFAVYCLEGCTTLIENNVFSGNAGAIEAYNCSPKIVNNVIQGNTAGILLYGGTETTYVINNTIVSNESLNASWDQTSRYFGGIYVYQAVADIENNIIAFNKGSGVLVYDASPTLKGNCVYGNNSGNYVNITDPTGTDGNISVDPALASPTYANVHIQPTSPCRNAGLNNAPYIAANDFDGQSRIQSDIIDIGADESNGTQWDTGPYAIIYVSSDGNDSNNGLTWNTAKKTIQAAVDVASSCGGEVWVKEGTYPGQIKMGAFSQIFGGFDGQETARSERDWYSNLTVISEEWGNYAIEIVAGTSGAPSVVDGFMVTGAYQGIACCTATPTIINNRIIGNGWGIFCVSPIWGFNFDGTFNASPTIVNNVIASNGEGGIYADGGYLTLINNALVNNGYAIYHQACAEGGTFANNIIAFNQSGVATLANDFTNNCVYGNDLFNYDSLYLTDQTGINGNISEEPEFVDLTNGDFRLSADSDCVDAGTTSVSLPSYDIAGNQRIQSSYVDMGPYESSGSTPTSSAQIVRVSCGGNDSNDGSTWALSKASISAAMNSILSSGGEVWVAEGTYNETLILPPYIRIYGGFDGTESLRDSRDWQSHTTTLNGQQQGTVVYASPGYAGTNAIDGFTITNGSAQFGGGINGYCTSCDIAHNIITDNTCIAEGANSGHGAGISCWWSWPTIRDNVISDNTATASGGIAGGIYCIWGNGGNRVLIQGNIISGNSASTGGGIYIDQGCDIINNTIVDNQADSGGGLYFEADGSVPATDGVVLANNIFASNSSGIENIGNNNYTLQNNDVYDNGTSNYTGVVPDQTDISADPLFTDLVANDCHLLRTSPCINAGSNNYAQGATVDWEGDARIFGGIVDIGADECLVSAEGIGYAKCYADGSLVADDGMAVAAVFGDSFYIQSEDRVSGILAVKSSHGLSVGDKVNCVGRIRTDGNYERYIDVSAISVTGTSTAKPLAVTNRTMGGGDLDYDSGSGSGQRGTYDTYGWNNIGLLIKAYGLVTYVDSTNNIFYINDGSDIDDGSGHIGIRVTAPQGVSLPQVDDQVTVVGASSCYLSGNLLQRLLRSRCQGDICVQSQQGATATFDLYAGWDYLSIPLVPYDPDPSSVFDPTYVYNRLYGFDPVSQGGTSYDDIDPTIFGNMQTGAGYQLFLDSSATLSYVGYPDGLPNLQNEKTDVAISLPGNQLDSYVDPPSGGGYHLVGHPFNHLTLADSGGYTGDRILFTDGKQIKNWSQAALSGWCNSYMNGFDPVLQGGFSVSYDDLADHTWFTPSRGYEFWTQKDNIAMIVPGNE